MPPATRSSRVTIRPKAGAGATSTTSSSISRTRPRTTVRSPATSDKARELAGRHAIGGLDRARLRQLGFDLGHALAGRSQGAWLATAADGAPVVLKRSPDPAMAERYAA